MQTTPPDHHRRSSNQSFSSSLLEAICNSLDESSPAKGAHVHDACTISRPVRASSLLVPRNNSTRFEPYGSSSKKRPSDFGTADDKRRTISQVLSSPSSSSSPNSPGARIAAFINSLFATSSRRKKHKTSTSCSSCLSKTRAKCRADESSGGGKHEKGGGGEMREGEETRARRERRRILMEEIMKRMEMEYESEDDLFELEICKGDGKFNGIIGDELPVYETTDPKINSAIARRLAVK